jgi:hypothetical protein
MIAGDTYGTGLSGKSLTEDVAAPSRLRAAGEQAKEKGADYMASHPLATMLAAIALGVTLGWLIKRR